MELFFPYSFIILLKGKRLCRINVIFFLFFHSLLLSFFPFLFSESEEGEEDLFCKYELSYMARQRPGGHGKQMQT